MNFFLTAFLVGTDKTTTSNYWWLIPPAYTDEHQKQNRLPQLRSHALGNILPNQIN